MRLDTYLDMLTNEKRQSPHTVNAYRRDLEALANQYPNKPLEALSSMDLRRALSKLHAQGLSPRSLGRFLSSWRGYFKWLQAKNLSKQNPCLGLKPPKGASRLPRALTPDEANKLLTTTPADDADDDQQFGHLREQAIFELLYSSGLRVSELASLNLEALEDLRNRELRVYGKRNKTRIVPVGATAKQAIDAWLSIRRQHAQADENALFINQRGKRLSVRWIQKSLTDRVRRQQLGRHVHPHMLRHSFASHVLQSSGHLRAVQEMLGHASITSTQVYTHLDYQHLAKVYDEAHPRSKLKPD